MSDFDINETDFQPPFTDPLIDEVFMEFKLEPVLFPDRIESRDPREMTTMGTSDRVEINLLVAVHCAENWVGTHCELECEPSDPDNCTQRKYTTRP